MGKTNMRHILIFLVAFLFAVPAKAVSITCVNEGNGVVRVDYDASDEKMLPIAFALDISVEGGATITKVYDYKVGDSNAGSHGFGIFPNSMQLDPNGNVIDWGSPVVSGGAGTPSVTLGMASRYYGKQNAPLVKGMLCRLLIDTHSAPIVNVKVLPNVNGGGIVLEDATAAKISTAGATLGIRVTKCKVVAGSLPVSDYIMASGFIDVGNDEFLAPGSIAATVNSEDMVSPCIQTFPINNDTFKYGIYRCRKTGSPAKTYFTFNPNTSKFLFYAKYVSLKGLSCPVNIETRIGNYVSEVNVDETIVNGARWPIPIKLMMGVKDSLRVDRVLVVRRSTPNRDRLIVKGGFSVKDVDVNMVNENSSLTIGSQTFTIPANKFKARSGRFVCSGIVLSDGSVAAARFNFKTGAFRVRIKNAEITTGAGNENLRLAFGGFNEIKQVNIQ
jgi:hypothetical protein